MTKLDLIEVMFKLSSSSHVSWQSWQKGQLCRTACLHLRVLRVNAAMSDKHYYSEVDFSCDKHNLFQQHLHDHGAGQRRYYAGFKI